MTSHLEFVEKHSEDSPKMWGKGLLSDGTKAHIFGPGIKLCSSLQETTGLEQLFTIQQNNNPKHTSQATLVQNQERECVRMVQSKPRPLISL